MAEQDSPQDPYLAEAMRQAQLLLLDQDQDFKLRSRWQLREKLDSLIDKSATAGLMVGVLVAAVTIRIGTAVGDYANTLQDKGYFENARMVKTTSYLIPALATEYSASNGLPINPLAAGILTFGAEGLIAIILRSALLKKHLPPA